jgi:competence protein ComEC
MSHVISPAPAVSWCDRRAIGVLALVALGYWLAADLVPANITSRPMLLAGFALGMVAYFLRGIPCKAALALAAISLSAGWFRARCDESPADHLSRALTTDPQLIRVEGMVLNAPELRSADVGEFARFEHHAGGSWHFDVRVSAVISDDAQPVPASGVLRVRAHQEPATLRAGERTVIRGFARAPSPAMNPGEPDRLRLARQDHIAGSIDVPTPEFITLAFSLPHWTERAASAWSRFAQRAQAVALGSLATTDQRSGSEVDEPTALLRAMLLGQRDDELRDLSDAFTRTGLAHVLSVSGMNLTLLAWFALMSLRLLGDHPRLEKLAVGGLVAGYLVVVPAEAPIIRAAIMIAVFLLAEWGGRRYDRLNTLAWAAVLSLLWRPMDLWSPGFQLSYLGVAALMTLSFPLRARLFGEPCDDDTIGGGLRGLLVRALETSKTGFAASLCAWAVTMPTVLWHTGVVNPIGPLSNLIVWPLVSAITGAGYAAVLAGTVVPWAASLVTPTLHWLAEGLAWVVRTLDAVPGGVRYVPKVSAAWCAAATVVIVLWMLGGRSPAKQSPQPVSPLERRQRGWPFAVAAIGLIGWLSAEAWFRPLLRPGTIEVAALHIPGGTCTALRAGRETVLYDCGSSWGGAGKRMIPRALRELGVATAHTVIVSHADTSAYNALIDIVRPLGVRRVLVGEQFLRQSLDVPDGPAAHLLTRLASLGVEVRTVAAGESIDLPNATIRVLAPAGGELMATHRDASLVIELVPKQSRCDSAVEARSSADEHTSAVVFGEIGRPGFESLRSSQPASAAGLVVMPSTGWLSTHEEQVIRWCGGVGHPPIMVVRADRGMAGADRGPTEVVMENAGCVRATWSLKVGWRTQTFRP